jgi:hypothetical protein
MFRAWKFIFLFTMSALLLVGCSQSQEDSATNGVKAASDAFYANNKNHNEDIDGINLYKPVGFIVSENSDAQNIIMTWKDDTFILFVNPNEKGNSRLFHDLLSSDTSKKVIAEETFTEDDVFGFAAVVKSDNENVELIASVGGVKMTTIAKGKKIEEELARMMEIVRSIKQEN